MTDERTTVVGYCPNGCGETLYLADGGQIMCSTNKCPDPLAVSKLLIGDQKDHIVTLSDSGFTVQHPLRERVDGKLHECNLYRDLSNAGQPDLPNGRYAVTKTKRGWTFNALH